VEIYDHEFAHCNYLAADTELDPRTGLEFILDTLADTKAQGKEIVVVLTGALTDMDEVMADERWEDVRSAVACIGVMGGVIEDGQGSFVMDRTAANNAFDLEAAERVHQRFRAADSPPVVVVSRFAAIACQMPRNVLDGCTHVVALRCVGVSEAALQKLWERSHRTPEKRRQENDTLPIRCDANWFRQTFLHPQTPRLGPYDPVWNYVKGFNEYDAIAMTAAVSFAHPPMFDEIFRAVRFSDTNVYAIGLNAERHGIANTALASEFLHDCLVLTFERRFCPQMKVQVWKDECWKEFTLRQSRGADAWLAENDSQSRVELCRLKLSVADEGVMWRVSNKTTPGASEPTCVDRVHSFRYREVLGMRMGGHLSQEAHDIMRRTFVPKKEDLFLVGAFGCGRASALAMCLALRHTGRLDDIDVDHPYLIDQSVARGRMDCAIFDQIESRKRVFKILYHPLWALPLQIPNATMLPTHGKFIYVVRDPRDVMVSNFLITPPWTSFNPTKVNFDQFFDLWLDDNIPTCGRWLSSCVEWWTLARAEPHRILWIIFEDMLRNPEAAVRRIASFVGRSVTSETVTHLAKVTQFSELCQRWKRTFAASLRKGIVGEHKEFFNKEHFAKFRLKVLAPVIAAGVPLAREVFVDDCPCVLEPAGAHEA